MAKTGGKSGGSSEVRELLRTAPEMIRNEEYDRLYQFCDRIRLVEDPPSPDLLYYGAISLFGLGHIRQAEVWVEERGQVRGGDVSQLYLEAYVHLHSRRPDQSLLCWTRILEIDPSDTFADSLIDKLKTGTDQLIREASRPGRLGSFVPVTPIKKSTSSGVAPSTPRIPLSLDEKSRDPYRKQPLLTRFTQRISRAALIVGFLSLILVVGSIAGVLVYSQISQSNRNSALFDNLPPGPFGGTVVDPVEYGESSPRFVYRDRTEALTDYEEARKLASEGLDNQARKLLGKIELSNSGFEIKERALLLRELIPTREKKNFLDPISVSEVIREPYIYRDAQVLWSGSLIGFTRNGDRTALLLDSRDDENRKIEIRVPHSLTLPPPDSIQNGSMVTVFGFYREIVGDGNPRVDAIDVNFE